MKYYFKILLVSAVLAIVSSHAAAKTLKIATLAPAGTTWMKEMKKGANEIKKKTEGRVKLKFYPGGVMGNDESVHRKIKIGQLHGGAFTSGGLSHVYPEIQTLSLPMLFDSFEEVDYVRSRVDTQLKHNIEDSGFVLLGISEGGFARILSQSPLVDLEAIRQSKVWIPEGDELVQSTFSTLGISPVSLPVSDVFTGLQTGLIETVTINPTAAIAFQWHSNMGYMTETPLTYIIGTLAIQKKAFDKLTSADQAIVRDEIDQVFKRLDSLNRSDNKSASDALRNQGIEFVKPGAAELKRWKALSEKSIQSMVDSGTISKAMLTEVNKHLSDFRKIQ
ncbi:MAG: TRAP transporter substrate-binding protein DctP [Gammaproteobacteria bacterium]|nr:TRAP transporter substrate-binding protein DctP [Gammaproteobacteria bacterium]